MTYASIQTTTMNANDTHTSLRRLLAALMLLTLGLWTTQTAHAQVPQRLAYQSLVSDHNGAFLNTGQYQVTFRLYTDQHAKGQALWSETQTVNVTDGLLSTSIGTERALDLPFDKPYFLTVQLGDQAESPAMPLSTAAYALKAHDVEDETVVRSISGLQDNVEIVAGDGISIQQRDNQLVISAAGAQSLKGYGPQETTSAVAASVKTLGAGPLTEEEDDKAIAALLQTLGPGGANTGLDAAYDISRVITIDAGPMTLLGSGLANGFVMRDVDMVLRDATGDDPEFRFRVDGASTVQVWLLDK